MKQSSSTKNEEEVQALKRLGEIESKKPEVPLEEKLGNQVF